MISYNSPTFLEITAALRIRRGYELEEVCNDYLKARFPNLTPRINTKARWTMSGTPDAFLFDHSGTLTAFQYGPPDGWRTKLLKDAEKVASLATRENLTVEILVFCTNAEIDLDEDASAQREVRDAFGFQLELCDLRRMADDIEKLFPGIAFRRLNIPIRIQRFITLDEYIDSVNRRFWPKRSDIEEKKLYVPEGYIGAIEELLVKNRRCLITGATGSGKTVLAVAFGLEWRGNEGESRKHPEAVGFYLDASVGYGQRDGESWYQFVRAHDYQNEIFIIDNSHLSPAAVSAFCHLWEQRPPQRSLVIFVSAPRVSESQWEDEPADYFESFSEPEVVTVHSADIFQGVLRAYSDFYTRADQECFVPVEEDLADPSSLNRIASMCSQSLVMTRSVAEAWGDVGGRVSDVTEEITLKGIADRYLTRRKSPALVPLCILAQFEIPSHYNYVRDLPQDSLDALIDENLINIEDTSDGRFYHLTLHSQVAGQIFRAHIRRQVGTSFRGYLRQEIASHLKKYLLKEPPNFIDVYRRVKDVQGANFQQLLLRDVELQGCAIQQASRNLEHGISYLSLLKRNHPDQAKDMLEAWVQRDIQKIKPQALLLFKNRSHSNILAFEEISPGIAAKVFGGFSAEEIAESLSDSSIGAIVKWLAPKPVSLSEKLGYSEDWRQQCVEALNLKSLSNSAASGSLQRLFWDLRALTKISPSLAEQLLEHITPRVFIEMLKEKPGPALKVLPKVLRYSAASFKDEVLKLIDDEVIDVLVARFKKGNIQDLYWLLRVLKNEASDLPARIITFITPTVIAQTFLEKEATAKHLRQLLAYLPKEFRAEFLGSFGEDDIVSMLGRSQLKHVINLIVWHDSWHRHIGNFASQHLAKNYATAQLSDIGRAIFALNGVERNGQRLAAEFLDALLASDLEDVLARSEAEALALLIYNAHSVHTTYSLQLVHRSLLSGAMGKLLSKSSIRGIDRLLKNTAMSAQTLLPHLTQYLSKIDLTNQFLDSNPLEISRFLWRVRLHGGKGLAQDYCLKVDSLNMEEWITNTEIEVLATYLWHLVQMAEIGRLETLESPLLKQRLVVEWPINPSVCLQIIGMISLANSSSHDFPTFRITDESSQKVAMVSNYMVKALKDRRPYVFALTVHGLRTVNDIGPLKWIWKTAKNKPSLKFCLKLLQETLENAVTSKSIELLVDTQKFLSTTENVS